jgi:hypothetical protein
MKRITQFALVGLFLMAAVSFAQAGAVGGPKVAKYSLDGRSTDVFTIRFHAGETAKIGVAGDGDTDLALAVYDESGNLIAFHSGTECLVEWTPKWTGRFTIKVVNLGYVYNNYVLVTN